MIDNLRNALDVLGEQYTEKNAVFKVKVIPLFCSVTIKKNRKHSNKLDFYTNQLLEVILAFLFVLFGLALFSLGAGITNGPLQIAASTFLFLHVLVKQIAIESLKMRIFLCEQNQPQSDR